MASHLTSDSFTLIQRIFQDFPLSILLRLIVVEAIQIFIDADTKIKDMQTGDYEIRIVNFDDDTTIFLREFTCRTKIELFLKLCEQPSSSKKKKIKKPDLMECGI